MKIYILNTPILTHYGEWIYDGPLSPSKVKQILEQGFISAVGHQTSAEFLTELLEIKISMNRIQITMNKGDKAVILNLKTRLPERFVLSDKEQIKDFPYEISLLTRIA